MSIAFKQYCVYGFIVLMAILTSIAVYRQLNQGWIFLREAEAEYSKKNFEKAIELYIISLNAGLPRSHMSLNFANSYVAIGLFKEAIPLYQEYLSNNSNNIEAHRQYAQALEWMGNNSEAVEELKKTLK